MRFPTLTTPPADPHLGLPSHSQRNPLARARAALAQLHQVWLEPQDRAGFWTLAGYCASGASAAATLLFSFNVVPFQMDLWNAAAWFFRHFNMMLWALPVAIGFASAKRLPRALAAFSLALACLYYGWHWLPVSGSPTIPIRVLYVASAAMIAVPALLNHLRSRAGPLVPVTLSVARRHVDAE